jgi:aqualysin 1
VGALAKGGLIEVRIRSPRGTVPCIVSVRNLWRNSTLKRVAILLALIVATTLLAAGVAFTQAPEEDADTYIVVLEDSVDDPSQVAEEIDQRQEGFDAGLVYTEALEGFSAEIPDDSLDDVRNNSRVAYVVRDEVVTAFDQKVPWGIRRIGADMSSTRAGNGSGKVTGVNIYVIDSGIATNPDLNVVKRHNMLTRGPDTDCYRHGTHVAGTLAARDNRIDVVGVAPGAPLTSVKVLDCGGHGTARKVIAGIDWVTKDVKGPDGRAGTTDDKKPAVVNMSLGGDKFGPLNTAVRNSVAKGIFYSLAAGNEGRNACNISPAMTGAGKNNGILTTAATNQADIEPSWSNFGRCVDLWAPGAKILSTWFGGATKTLTGTSMAAPHAGGTAALYLSTDPPKASPGGVESRLRSDSKLVIGNTSRHGAPIRIVNARKY